MAPNRKAIKYRVLAGQIDELIKGTGCDKRSAPPVRLQLPSGVQKLDSPNERLVFAGRSLL